MPPPGWWVLNDSILTRSVGEPCSLIIAPFALAPFLAADQTKNTRRRQQHLKPRSSPPCHLATPDAIAKRCSGHHHFLDLVSRDLYTASARKNQKSTDPRPPAQKQLALLMPKFSARSKGFSTARIRISVRASEMLAIARVFCSPLMWKYLPIRISQLGGGGSTDTDRVAHNNLGTPLSRS